MGSIQLSEFPSDTYIFLDKKCRNKIIEKLEKKYGYLTRAGKKIGIVPRNLYEWKSGIIIKYGKPVKRYISLYNLKTICNAIDADINSLQKYVTEIKTGSRSGVIKELKLPLPIVSETFAVLGHMLSDGYGGEMGNACYVNTSNDALYNFIDKLKKAFGNVHYSINIKHNRVIISKLVPKILKKYFDIDDFRSSKSKITSKIFNAPKDCLIEFVKAVIIDEGSVADSGVYVDFVANPKLTKDFKRICEELDYSCYLSKGCVIISSRSFPKLLKDIKNLVISDKQKMLLKWFNRKSRKWYNRYRGTTKKEIVELLLKKPMSVKELSSEINVKCECIRAQIKGYSRKGRYVPGLIDLGILEVKDKGWKDTAIFGVKDTSKALLYANNR